MFAVIGFLAYRITGGPLLVLGIASRTVVGLVSSALSGIFQAALYNYATTGESNRFFDPALLQTAFKPKG